MDTGAGSYQTRARRTTRHSARLASGRARSGFSLRRRDAIGVASGRPGTTVRASMGDVHEPYATFRATPRFGSLDGLRFLAVVPVVFHHSTPRPLPGILGKGPLGVDLFFAISGFLITTLLLRERESTSTVGIRAFYTRRALRILPLYYVVLGLTVLRALTLDPTSPIRAHFFASLPAYATFTTTWFVDFGVPHAILFAYSWSLAVEEQFYAFWPWVVRQGRIFPWIGCVVLLAVDLVAERAGSLSEGATLALKIASSLRAPLLLGALLACALHWRIGYRFLSFVLGRRHAGLVVLLGLAVALGTTLVPRLGTQALLVMLVGACVVREDHSLAPLLRLRPVVHVGGVSYGVYMLHLAAIWVAKKLLGAGAELASGALVFAIAMPLSVLFATASHRGFESKFLALWSKGHGKSLPS